MITWTINLIKKKQQFFKYCVGGGTAAVIDFSLLYILTDIVGIWYLWSATLAFAIAAIANYLIQKFWTFKCSEKRVARQFFVFLGVQIIGLFINNTTMYLLVEHASIWYILAKVIAAAIVLIWNFWASKMFVFNRKHLKKKYKVLLAGEIFPPDIGGPATYTHRIARYLLDKGYDLRIVCYSSVLPAQADEEFGHKIVRVSANHSLLYKYLIYFIKLLNIAPQAQMIYAQGPVASAFPAFLVSKILGKKLIIKVVGDYAWEQSRLFNATQKNIDDWQHQPEFDSKNKLTNLKLQIVAWIEKKTVSHATKVIVPSGYLKKIVRGWGVSEEKIKVIYNSFEYTNQAKLTKDEAQAIIKIKGDIIVTVARLMNWKGMDTLIKIMPELLRINPAFKLLIIGDGPEQKKLSDLIKKLKLDRQVIMVGRVHYSKMCYYYLASSIFVLNSGYEGLSHVILEAMNYKLPIIASHVGGNEELIQDGFNGLLVEYNDRPSWIRAIKDLWHDKEKRVRFATNPLGRMEVFSFNRMISETIKVLKI